jgi:hypothetical protein
MLVEVTPVADNNSEKSIHHTFVPFGKDFNKLFCTIRLQESIQEGKWGAGREKGCLHAFVESKRIVQGVFRV